MSRKKSVPDVFSLGGRFRSFRKDNNLTQQEVASSIGLSQNFISAVESDKENLSKPVLLLLNNLYRINVEWLLTGEGPMYAEPPEACVPVPFDEATGKILLLLKDMADDARRDILRYVEDKKLLADLKRERKRTQAGKDEKAAFESAAPQLYVLNADIIKTAIEAFDDVLKEVYEEYAHKGIQLGELSSETKAAHISNMLEKAQKDREFLLLNKHEQRQKMKDNLSEFVQSLKTAG